MWIFCKIIYIVHCLLRKFVVMATAIQLEVKTHFIYEGRDLSPGNAETKSRCNIGRRNTSIWPCWWWHICMRTCSTNWTCSFSDHWSKYPMQMFCCSRNLSDNWVLIGSSSSSSDVIIIVPGLCTGNQVCQQFFFQRLYFLVPCVSNEKLLLTKIELAKILKVNYNATDVFVPRTTRILGFDQTVMVHYFMDR